MAIPRVFISSTCYDLKHIRENLKFFVKTIGYESVLSDEGDVFYSPYSHTHESCLKEVETCQLFILIIGGRYGGNFKDTDKSITNNEYKEAVKQNIPIFTLVEAGVYSDHNVYNKNKKDKPNIYKNISYPNIDDIKIFDFVDEVRNNGKNNAIQPFRNFSDMEIYLKKQWAGMMYDFLLEKNKESESKLTNKLLDNINLASRKTEELVKYLLKQSNQDNTNIDKEIENIDNKIEAEKFVQLVIDKFNLNELPKIALNKLINLDINNISWIEFLEFLGFKRTKSPDNKLEILWAPHEKMGLQIKKEGVVSNHENFVNLTETFSSLKKLNEKDKKDIYQKFVDLSNK
ncbi:DUF4062 domain-containing protein [Arcobacter venerupis]|uniref:DUF4062 domain-containing protein n=1 Tax=Arcobacter venerupis TaxID=1054033 RepID=A0AAE7E5K9_9BACT|nr:DUF4062 domain-containing protein [Arcobacter venerupis]QKF68574.1 DUF4062 domain-containing protein [Arcobacter venerupis]RWS48729.1 hypothetical protein CKA56_12795 [Arcobacter venerupis]